LPPLLDTSLVPSQEAPFAIPDSYEEIEAAVLAPIKDFMENPPAFPEGAKSAHPFKGGEVPAQKRLQSLMESEAMINYNSTRNGLVGTEFSTKLSGYLAQGCLTARQIHEAIVSYEDGTNAAWKEIKGYGEGENEGTMAVRFELLWRDYMRLCTRKFKHKLFRLQGFRGGTVYEDTDQTQPKWKTADASSPTAAQQEPKPEEIAKVIERFNAGTTGMGLIDASQRELIHTGYTSNRARQNVASFLAKHLSVDWRYGAEWYEMLLVDYDVCSNWANWQYVAGVGNDPRGSARIFNPVKQAFDYDKDGEYVRTWVPEVKKLEKLENVFQAWTASEEELEHAGLTGNPMVTDPIKKIDFSVEGKPRPSRQRGNGRRRGQGRRGGGGNQAEGVANGSPMPSGGQAQASGLPPTAPSQHRYYQGGYQDGDGYRGGYMGRGGRYRGGRGLTNNGGRGGYRGGRGLYHGGPPQPSWAPQPPGATSGP